MKFIFDFIKVFPHCIEILFTNDAIISLSMLKVDPFFSHFIAARNLDTCLLF